MPSIMHIENLAFHPDFEQINTISILSQTAYLLLPDSVTLPNDPTIILESNSYSPSDVSSSRVTANDYTSSIRYNFDTEYFLFLTENTIAVLEISLTCAYSPFETITHTLVAHGTNPLPTWVSLDAARNKLIATVPGASASDYFVAIQTQLPACTSTFTKVIQLRVTACQSKN